MSRSTKSIDDAINERKRTLIDVLRLPASALENSLVRRHLKALATKLTPTQIYQLGILTRASTIYMDTKQEGPSDAEA